MTIKDLLADKSLPKIELEILLANLLQVDRSYLSAFSEEKVSQPTYLVFLQMKKERQKSKPLAYILGYQAFYGRNFLVNQNVLIPRPETENLVQKVLNFSRNKDLTIVDLGTGSGCIAITLLLENPKIKVIAADISSQALAVAKKNAKLYQVDHRLRFVQGDLLARINFPIDVIVANLPYIPTKVWNNLPLEIKKFEPRIALDSGPTKKSLYDKVFSQCHGKIKTGGKMFYEIDGNILVSDLTN